MKKLLLGIVIGAALASGVFYFINMYEENEQKAELKELLETAKQNQAINKQSNETINDPVAMRALQYVLTVVAAGNDQFYFFRNNDCSNMEHTDLVSMTALLKDQKKRIKPDELMIIIKLTTEASYKNSIDLLDAITSAGIPAGHFAEVELSEKEKNCIQHYKKN